MRKIFNEFNNKKFLRVDKKFISNKELKKKIINTMITFKIPMEKLEETEKSFIVENQVFFKNLRKEKEEGILKIRSKDLIFNDCFINPNDIKFITKNQFKTHNFKYYLIE